MIDDTPPGHDRRSQRLRRVLLVAALLLLSGTVMLAVRMADQSSRIERSIESNGDALVTEIRVLSQAQRDLLRLSAHLESDASADAGLLVDAIDRRLGEAAGSGIAREAGSNDLAAEIDAVRASWTEDVAPRVTGVADDPTALDGVIGLIDDFERQLDELIEGAEDERVRTAAASRDEALDLLQANRVTLAGMVVLASGFLAALAVAAVLFRRDDRERERHRAELLELLGETRMLSLVASRSYNLVVVTDDQGRIEWVNDAFIRTSGYSLDEVKGRTPGSFLQGPKTDPTTTNLMRRRLRAGQPFHVEVLNYASDGSTYWVEIDAQPVRNERDEITNFIAVQADITEQKLTADHLRRTRDAAEDLARAKSSFLASMSHEIRTPLNAMLGLTELLLETELDEQQREFVTTAHGSGQLLLEILNNILDFSALEAGRVEIDVQPFEIRPMIARVAETLAGVAERRGIALTTSVADDVPTALVGDPARLQQILVNVVSNAIKFTEQGSVTVAAHWSRANLEIAVRDTGIGIPADRIDRLFEPFSQADVSISRRFGGTGLGLAISRHLAEMLGGALTLESVEGEGTTVRLVAPMAVGTPRPAPSPVASEDDAGPTTALRILVAEDDAVNRRVAEHMLSRLGHDADFVVDGERAIQACLDRHYDLVFMDVQMPGRDGLEATSEIRRRLPEDEQPRIIALTASALTGDRERFLSAGMDGYLSKPVELKRLAEAIETHAPGRRTPSTAPTP